MRSGQALRMRSGQALHIRSGQALRMRSGQAIIEVCVCLVAIVVVLIAMLQLNSLTMMQTNTMNEARSQAAGLAMGDISISTSPGYLDTWDEADDEKRYTSDDDPINGSPSSFFNYTIEKSVSDASEWNVFADAPNAINSMHESAGNPSAYFGLVRGESSATTNLLHAFQKLIYDKESITIESEVWMTWTKGIY